MINSLRQKSDRLVVIFGLSVAMVVTLVLSGVGLVTSLLMGVVISAQYLTGLGLRRSLGDKSASCTWGNWSASFGVGVLVSSVSHLSLMGTPVERFGWLIPLGIVGPIGIVRSRNVRTDSVSMTESVYAALAICAVTLVALGKTYRWQLPIGIALVVGIVLIELMGMAAQDKIRRIVLWTGVIATTSLLVLAGFYISTRSMWWWTINSDITFTEAASQTLGRWGITDHAAAVGQSVLGGYHWLPFTWSGVVDRFTGADAWWITTRGAHVVFIFGSSAALWSMFRDVLSFSRFHAFLSMLLAGLVGMAVGQNFSLMVGIFWVLAILAYLAEKRVELSSTAHFVTVFLLGLGALLAKPQIAVPLIGGIILLGVVRMFEEKKLNTRQVLEMSLLAMSLVVLFSSQRLLVGSNPAASGLVELDLISIGSFGELGNARNIVALPLAAISALSLLMLPLALLVVAGRFRELPWLIQIIASTILVTTVALFVSDAAYHSLAIYLVSLIVLLTGLIIGASFHVLMNTLKRSTVLVVVLVLFLPILSFTTNRWATLFNPEPTGSVIDMSLRTLAGARWIPAVVLTVVIVCLYWYLQKKNESFRLLPVALTVLVILLVNPLYRVNETVDRLLSNETVSDVGPQGVLALDNGSPEFMELVSTSIGEDEIIASNVFCPYDMATLCGSSDWWGKYQKSVIADHLSERCYELLIFAIDWSLPGALERRFLIQGPQMFEWCTKGQEWLNERVTMSEEFGRESTQESFRYLCKEGVTWFIADKAVSALRDWEPYGEIVREEERLVLIRLRVNACPSGSF